jgi:hypothetical protein
MCSQVGVFMAMYSFGFKAWRIWFLSFEFTISFIGIWERFGEGEARVGLLTKMRCSQGQIADENTEKTDDSA